MPVVLRSKKSMHRSDDDEEERDTTTTRRRRIVRKARTSSRLQVRPTYNMESENSDSDPVYGQVMERLHTDEEEEETVETTETEVKPCSVVLDRFRVTDNASKREPEERDDMNRKSAKPASRIPTFNKRPATLSAEMPLSKKELPLPVVQPAEKPASVLVDTSKCVQEKNLLSYRIPIIGGEVSTILSNTEQTSEGSTPNACMLSEGVQYGIMASPRPALRAEGRLIQEQHESQCSATSKIDSFSPEIPCLDSLSQDNPQEDKPPGSYVVTKRSVSTTVTKSTELDCMPNVSQTEAIVNEQPPWEREHPHTPESQDVRSSSDVDSEDDFVMDDSGDAKDHNEPQIMIKTDQAVDVGKEDNNESVCHTAVEKSATAPSKSAKSRPPLFLQGSGRPLFAFCFLLPATLLLLGMHAWHFGLPMSVSQLAAQLELHWLEGVGLMAESCSRDCRVDLVESIPVGLYPSSPSTQQSTAASWLRLLGKAHSSVSIAAFYVSLRSNDEDFAHSVDTQGRKVFDQLKQLLSKDVKLQMVVNSPQTFNQDTEELAAAGAKIKEVDLKSLTGGIVHTKLLVVDQKHFYLGSANMDWRSLSQVKEVGVIVEDCSCLAQDASRIFELYRSLNGSLPPYWPARFTALSSAQHPLRVQFNGVATQVYLSSSPPHIAARGRSDDLTTILSVIHDAQKFIFISVMDYLPLSEFTKPLRFWPDIDSAVRAAACTRGVKVRLLVSCWEHSPAAMFPFLQSLLVLNRPPLKCDIEVKIFTVHSTAEQMKIPFARVNHAKYMVTDRVLYIGTSNWSETFFSETAGVGLVVNQTDSVAKEGQGTVRSGAEELFLRDWRSHYASSLSAADVRVCPRRPH
ncbi:5'-3' exonuclease PLD3 isoform X1 [Entelurus aequoreus]|uniref:5'-3' exonuclease PLD3 isoform X1 n=2 Tax=Entelurus aequoreus TaxID=161455 RepID=UPI002B1DF695|nr:5'-3' exonuclease PLD3 isoform X1 [Entelurus aequoreus]XP_061901258.1 5'-3' exonuclease PLD3 isoform X1 [Entelurus aequoreus]